MRKMKNWILDSLLFGHFETKDVQLVTSALRWIADVSHTFSYFRCVPRLCENSTKMESENSRLLRMRYIRFS
jgi:hypothetical protein